MAWTAEKVQALLTRMAPQTKPVQTNAPARPVYNSPRSLVAGEGSGYGRR